MPYITPGRRLELARSLGLLIEDLEAMEAAEGDYNYAITSILLSYKPKTYAEWNGLIGILECCKMELARRGLAKYEDGKARENGDLPGFARNEPETNLTKVAPRATKHSRSGERRRK